MKKPQPKTNAQIRRIFGLAKGNARDACMDVKDYLSDLASHVTRERTAHLSELTFAEANDMIKLLGGEPFKAYGHSKRSENYRKQKAGIKSVETENHVSFMTELARLRGMSDEGLEKMGTRMIKHWPPRTTEEGNKIIEALKAMNKRDGLSASPRPRVSASPDPAFRRVA